MYKFMFYVAGKDSNSQGEVRRLKKLLDKKIKNDYDLKIIDIIKEPTMAEEKKIVATPMLEKTSPKPVRRIIGDLSDEDKVIIGLDLTSFRERVSSQRK